MERDAKNRLALIGAAEAIFVERGIDGASMDEIAEHADLTKGALYTRFSGKGDLVLAVIEHRLYTDPDAEASAALLVNANLTAQERFEGWIAQWIAVFRSGTRTQFARLLFEFVPYALRDPDLMTRFAAIVSPGHATVETAGPNDAEPQLPSPIPPGSAFAALPVNDQRRILSALDLGLAFQSLILPKATDPELYGTALRLLTSEPATTRSADGEQ
ncbi:MAG: TetR/AcrR family transcriptional regulator [Actinomycetota bacterium]|nr:TetR/AcrR family transcriptional regulator [Actinomycetota bacterium]